MATDIVVGLEDVNGVSSCAWVHLIELVSRDSAGIVYVGATIL